jgi:hypothetical protein
MNRKEIEDLIAQAGPVTAHGASLYRIDGPGRVGAWQVSAWNYETQVWQPEMQKASRDLSAWWWQHSPARTVQIREHVNHGADRRRLLQMVEAARSLGLLASLAIHYTENTTVGCSVNNLLETLGVEPLGPLPGGSVRLGVDALAALLARQGITLPEEAPILRPPFLTDEEWTTPLAVLTEQVETEEAAQKELAALRRGLLGRLAAEASTRDGRKRHGYEFHDAADQLAGAGTAVERLARLRAWLEAHPADDTEGVRA